MPKIKKKDKIEQCTKIFIYRDLKDALTNTKAKRRKPLCAPEFHLPLLTPATQARQPPFFPSIFSVKRTGITTGFTVECYLNLNNKIKKILHVTVEVTAL